MELTSKEVTIQRNTKQLWRPHTIVSYNITSYVKWKKKVFWRTNRSLAKRTTQRRTASGFCCMQTLSETDCYSWSLRNLARMFYKNNGNSRASKCDFVWLLLKERKPRCWHRLRLPSITTENHFTLQKRKSQRKREISPKKNWERQNIYKWLTRLATATTRNKRISGGFGTRHTHSEEGQDKFAA